MEEAKLTLNFIGAAVAKRPKNVPTDLKLRAGFTPNFGDVVSFEGLEGAFLVHSREFQIGANGVVDVILNIDVVQAAR
ncbi:hypothetical protein NE850_27635 [Paraburkholderia sp. USG1]|uniref:hypothetical protein n=1 Tax=Paraburkholderia sp. USG1 TaxID=2952268 RepID=UPI00285CA07F|nr:hypothetical protein [Paraburkholderia sp. USG1]MDR8400086.1 hypothetical protein [Paraburkholderia sp. USG1]